MAGKQSKDKGKRGELEAMHLLGSKFKRTGYAGTKNPDLTSDFAIVSVKNIKTPISLARCVGELIKLECQERNKEHFVMVKVEHRWLIIERAEQFREARC